MSRVNPNGQPTQQTTTVDTTIDDNEDVVLGDGAQEPHQGAPWVLDGVDDEITVVEEPVQQQPPQQQQRPVRQGQGQPPQRQPQQQQPVQQQPGGQHEVRLRTGHVFRGATPEEALSRAQDHLNRLADGMVDRGYQQQPQQQPVQQPQRPAWSNEEFYKTFATDPRQAMDAYFEDRLGMPIDEFRQTVDHSYSVATQVEDRIAIADFMAQNQDYPASEESGALLVKRLARDNVPMSSWNLEVAYRQLVREGALVPIQVEQERVQEQSYQDEYEQPNQGQPPVQPQYQQQQQQPPRRRGAGAPPVPPQRQHDGSGTALGDTRLSIEQFEGLSTADMKRYMERRRQLGDRFY